MSGGTAGRCPRCGGLVREDAGWCGQCLAPLGPLAPGPPRRPPTRAAGVTSPAQAAPGPSPEGPAEAPPPASADGSEGAGAAGGGRSGGPPGARRRARVGKAGGRLVWACPACEGVNPLETPSCARCGTPFSQLLREPPARPTISPERAFRLSLLFPGAGHAAAGRLADGVARGVVFAWVAGTLVAMLVARSGGVGPFPGLFVLYLLAAAVLYGVTAVDARRVAESSTPLLDARVLLYGSGALMLLTVALLVLSGARATP